MNPIEKPRVVMSKMFLLFGVSIITRQCYDMLSVFTPDSAFQSALLHSSIPNTSKLSTPVIGLSKTWYIPLGIIDQYWTTMPFIPG